MNWTGAAEYKTAPRYHWKVQPSDTEVSGYVRQVKDFYQVRWWRCDHGPVITAHVVNTFPFVPQVIIRGGGHILPYDQPARSFDMIDRFLSTRGWI